MVSVLRVGLSAIKAFGKKMETVAENVANLYSEDYEKSRTIMKDQDGGGVIVEIQRQHSPEHEVELTEEISQSIIAQHGYEANLKTIQTGNELLGTLMDILD